MIALPRLLLIGVLLGAACGPPAASAAQVDEAALDGQIREIAKTLRCAVCQTENIWESQSTLAAQMRGVIRERLEQGESPEQIKAYFLSRYGDYILMQPRKKGLNWLIWAGPFALLAVGGALLVLTLRRWTKRTAAAPQEEASPLNERSRARLDRELHSFDK
ncbi:MAG: cytochrome c-type biogenesis protein [Nitrospirota bacterium]